MTASARWAQGLIADIDFAARTPAQRRVDADFDWNWYYAFTGRERPRGLRATLRAALRPSPPPSDPVDSAWIRAHATPLWETRAAFADEASRIQFDRHLVLRASGGERCRFGPTEHEPILEVLAEHAFEHSGLPDRYVGLPLRRFHLRSAVHAASFEVIITAMQLQLLNHYRQYLIARDGVFFGPRPGDTVLDCGACIGDISMIFAALVGAGGAVHAFDPVPLHARYCALQAAANPPLQHVIRMCTMAVGARPARAQGTRSDVSEVSPGGLMVDAFDTTSIDAYADQHALTRIDLIKMDIEGAELAALDGAQQVLARLRPRLAISVYHRPQDLWEIPARIRAANPRYRLYFAHHSPVEWESVVYAIDPGD
jgi:FkbM family methyltransferase